MEPLGRPQRRLPFLLIVLVGAACSPSGEGPDADSSADRTPAGAEGGGAADVRAGIEVLLSDSLHMVEGRRVGLVTNHTGIDRAGNTSIDLLHARADLELVALFGPEHGLRGEAEAGEIVDSGVDARTGLPVHSLYTTSRRPPPEALEGLDVLLFDIQDVGSRYYTYVWTMALAMEAAGEADLPFIVLDRPNPIDGVHVQGNVLDPAFATFVGLYPVPMRHGLTPGELARLLVGELGVEVELHVVPAEGWRRGMLYQATGLPWVAPSPNMPSVESALHYPGTCLFEGTNLSVGRGTDRAFQWIGAPWLDGEALAAALEARALPGVRVEAVTFTPEAPGDGKYGGETVHGVRFVATDPDVYDPPLTAVAAVIEARRLAGDRWEWREGHFDRLAGTDRVRLMIEEGRPVEEIVAPWAEQIAAFEALRRPYLIYP